MKPDYPTLLQTLQVQFSTAYRLYIQTPLIITNFYEGDDLLIHVHSGQISCEQDNKKITAQPGELLFIPGGKTCRLTYGSANPTELTYEQLITYHEQYIKPIGIETNLPKHNTSFSCIQFHTQVLKAINLFHTLDISPFILPTHEKMTMLIKNILSEHATADLSQKKVLQHYTAILGIELMRYLVNEAWFTAAYLGKRQYFQDKRLLVILTYIQQNLHADLSNSALAGVAHISEDYMGQYFKLVTSISPQAYVENQRLDAARRLLRDPEQKIYQISKQVGFKDTAYFCRRFKLKFGVQANTMRGWF